ncbi:hypothetical protein N802_01015 [Knoellia sinensis KCTC 19936]|uniref:Uncharacterized protein n=1 Tax=Knoellia sinensis KCTC 19936 TaxID=1385520 RepID=A0A0A0JHB0_9MICO|nr:hypothetical protein [Knoellia sinensis]KGN34996.1 hypothetical protein N802_01015 [Knoellia sinensis KCTC 19936]
MTAEELMQKIRDKYDEFQRKMDDCLEKFNSVVRKIGRFFGWAADKAVDLWNSVVVPLWNKFTNWFADHWNVFGAPWLMYGAADDWRKDVGQVVTPWGGTVTQDTTDVDAYWKGTASDIYVARAKDQVTAFKAVGPIAEKIAGALDNVALAIIVWWGSIVTAIMAAIAGVLVAAASVATGPGAVVGIPLGVKLAIAGFFVSVLVGTGVLTGTCLVQKGNLNGALTDMSAFPGSKWPTFA